MKEYPSIPFKQRDDIYIYAFDKLDGSNIRAEWNHKRGFYKFGSRHQLISSASGVLNKAPDIIQRKYGEELSKVFETNKWRDAICFFEFYGPNSKFGHHQDEDHDVVLIDVNPFKKGILPPKEFIDLFGHLPIPNIVYQGLPTEDFVQGIRASTIPGVTNEGVVCKGKNDKKTLMPIMYKIKSQKWYDELKEFCRGDEELFRKLA